MAAADDDGNVADRAADLAGHGPQLREDLHPFLLWQAEVQHEEIEFSRDHSVQGGLAVPDLKVRIDSIADTGQKSSETRGKAC